MNTEQFAYWLQGFSEIVGKAPTEKQWLVIQDHLQLVFKKETPNRVAELAKTMIPSSPTYPSPGIPGGTGAWPYHWKEPTLIC